METDGRFFCSPRDPSAPFERLPFVCGHQRWDCGYFKLFAQRRGLLHHVPFRLREIDEPTPYIEIDADDPTQCAERQSLLQTWFFFGLLAEFLCINAIDYQSPIEKPADKTHSLNQLYNDFTTEKDGKKYVTMEMLFDEELWDLFDLKGDAERWVYLRECLKFTCRMINHIDAHLDLPIWLSISALGEYLTTVIKKSNPDLNQSSHSHRTAIPNWGNNYMLDPSVETRMITAGWCRSDIARTMMTYPKLSTQHYISQMKKPLFGRNHDGCSTQQCNAAQIIPGDYKLSHVQEDCTCSEISVDIEKIEETLMNTAGYPVLRVEKNEDLDSLTIHVEPYVADEQYVAISHVWADGLGNPNANSLQRCQVSRLAELLDVLGNVTASESHNNRRFSLWIDTLCCPALQSRTKSIAINRLPAVYREATHVLVLDASISSFRSRELHPAEVCLRALASSSWMRRLWTLQEGALAKSLYFQFADDPVSLSNSGTELYETGRQDARYRAIWSDVYAELLRLNSTFWKGVERPHIGWTWPQHLGVHNRMYELQENLHFRSVSVDDDEPLCIATLLSLDMREISPLSGLDTRMKQLWKLVASEGQGIPSQVIFYVDNPISLPGFGWAPRSLLGASDPTHMSVRFLPQSRFASGGTIPEDLGTLSSHGLKVIHPGFKIESKSWRKDFPFRVWEGVTDTMENHICCHHESSGRWFLMSDFFDAAESSSTNEKTQDENPSPTSAMKSRSHNNTYLIRAAESLPTTINNYLMVQSREDRQVGLPEEDEDGDGLYVNARGSVTLNERDSVTTRGLTALRELAIQVAHHQLTLKLNQTPDTDSEERQTVVAELKDLMADMAASAFDNDARFKEFVTTRHSTISREMCWLLLPFYLPFECTLEEMPEDQCWVVDRKVRNSHNVIWD